MTAKSADRLLGSAAGHELKRRDLGRLGRIPVVAIFDAEPYLVCVKRLPEVPGRSGCPEIVQDSTCQTGYNMIYGG